MTEPTTAVCDASIDLGASTPGTEAWSVHVECERTASHDGPHTASVYGFTGPNGGASEADVEWMT